jgi:hypothetical protein
MSKRATTVEWHVATDDTEWQNLCALPLAETPPCARPGAHGRLYLKWFLAGAAAILLLVSTSGWWYSAQPKLHQGEAELHATAEPKLRALAVNDNPGAVRVTDDQATLSWEPHFARGHTGLGDAGQTALPVSPLDVTGSTFKVQGDQALAQVVIYTEHGEPAYRQTRFYRHTAEGWQQTAPDVALWGPVRGLETRYFVFHFRQNDAPAVIAVAQQVDTLYATLRRNFGLPISHDELPTMFGGEKLVIDVSVTQTPGNILPWDRASDRFLVPSPAVYLAPVELTDADLLAQSLALPLFEQVLAQAKEQYQISSTWQPLLDGLRLWQVWDLDLPLSTWRVDVVQWLYADLTAISGHPIVVPERYTDLCATHKLWLLPAQIHIPLLCTDLDRESWYFFLWGLRDPPTHLAQIVLPRPTSYPYTEINHRGQTVALATLIEYAAATYGRERLPVLVAGLGHYDNWETLLPAVFGVSAAEFEADWQVYLMAHYGVSSFPPGVNPNR